MRVLLSAFACARTAARSPVLEALAHGRPVVCLDLGGPRGIAAAGCGRVIVTHGRRRQVVRELADALQELADAPGLRQRLGRGARAGRSVRGVAYGQARPWQHP
jgi:glycosyltransferase involved in cell wall biosynthesis